MMTLLLVPLMYNCVSCQLKLNNVMVVYVGGWLARVSPLRVSVFTDPGVCLLYCPNSNVLHSTVWNSGARRESSSLHSTPTLVCYLETQINLLYNNNNKGPDHWVFVKISDVRSSLTDWGPLLFHSAGHCITGGLVVISPRCPDFVL